MTERLVLVGSDQTTWVSVVQFLLGFRIIPAVIRHFRLHEHFPNCCLPQALGGDVPETNVHDFYEFCTENAQVVEKKYIFRVHEYAVLSYDKAQVFNFYF